jgi:uncharacterized protein (TIGR02145 family)
MPVTVSDVDGNSYPTVIIGTQVWMAENLKTTKYNDGSIIPLVTDGAAWTALSTPGYCFYNNDAPTYKAIYGTLYNCYALDAVSNGGKNVCPTGWHVPSDAEWTILTDYLGGESVAGAKIKEAGTSHWYSPNTGATNESGFTALPGGFRNINGIFNLLGYYGNWWTSTQFNTVNNWVRTITWNSLSVSKPYNDKRDGFSVRCLKD